MTDTPIPAPDLRLTAAQVEQVMNALESDSTYDERHAAFELIQDLFYQAAALARPRVPEGREGDGVIAEIATALAKAEAKHAPMRGPHEGYAVILEELDELWAEVKRQSIDPAQMRKEALHVAAMGARFVKDLCTSQAASRVREGREAQRDIDALNAVKASVAKLEHIVRGTPLPEASPIPAQATAYRGHIDSDCEVVRGVGWMCTCQSAEEKARDAQERAECEAERDAEALRGCRCGCAKQLDAALAEADAPTEPRT